MNNIIRPERHSALSFLLSFLLYSALACSTLLSQIASGAVTSGIADQDDYECSGSYETNCLIKFPAHRRTYLRFAGGEKQMGPYCAYQTVKLQNQVAQAENLAGAPRNTIKINPLQTQFYGQSGYETYWVCEYQLISQRKDVRFGGGALATRYWISESERQNECLEDVKKADMISGSIAARASFDGALLQGNMCTAIYVTIGVDKILTSSDGQQTLVKYGTSEWLSSQ